MNRILFASLAVGLGLGATGAVAAPAGGFQVAQVMTTPQGCHWVDAGGRAQDLWCRDADGRARRTETRRVDTRDYADTGCPRGKVDDGLGCITERAALRYGEIRRAAGLMYEPETIIPYAGGERLSGGMIAAIEGSYGYYGRGYRPSVGVLHQPRGGSYSVFRQVYGHGDDRRYSDVIIVDGGR